MTSLKRWRSVVEWCQNSLEGLFAITSKHIANHPWITIFGSLFVACCCLLGLLFIKLEYRAEKLFVPEGNQATIDLQIAEKYFQIRVRSENVIFTPKTRKDILSSEYFKEMLKVHQKIVAIPSYLEHCAPRDRNTAPNRTNQCMILSPLELFHYKEEKLTNVSQILTALYYNKVSPFIMSNGLPAYSNFPSIFGGLVVNVTTQKIVSAEAVRIVYYMRDPQDYEGDKEIRQWEGKFLKLMSNISKNLQYMNVFYSASRSLDDAVSESTSSDTGLVAVTFALMITFACTMMANFRNPIRGHALLGIAGIFAVVLGTGAGFGVVMLAGTPFISMVGVLPFLIVGIGIDDMFILVDALDRQDLRMPVSDTIRMVMSHTGVTITMTTVTDLVAFAISTSTQFPSVRYFCIYAAVSITFAYLLMVTFFVGIMVLDVRRIKGGPRDLLPFCYAPRTTESENDLGEPCQPLSGKIMALWARFLMRPVTKAFVVILSCILLAGGIYGAINIDERFDRYVLAKKGSYWREFFAVQDKYFLSSIPVSLVITEKINYENPSVQSQILKLSDIAANNRLYENFSVSWVKELNENVEKFSSHELNGSNFLPALKTFLSIPFYFHFNKDIKLSADGQTVEVSRVTVFIKKTTDSILQKDAMLSLRNDLVKMSKLPVRAVSAPFPYFEQYAITRRDTIRNLALASGTVLIITFPFLANFSATVLVFFGFTSLVFELFGMMYLWDVSLNSVSMIILIMAVGLSVDYSAHIAHAYLISDRRSPDERIEHALTTIGGSVVMGGKSSYIKIVLIFLFL